MIDPSEIRRKADNLYPAFLTAWLAGEEFFPRAIPCEKRLDDNLAVAAESIRRLKSQAKEVRGFGYSIEWQERASRTHGRNRFPRRVVFETADDLLRYISKQHEFADFAAAVERLRRRHPPLDPWIRSHRQLLIDNAPQLDGLLQVVDYLLLHPRPGLFARELPLDVDTKFIERNRTMLREWLDLLLPPHAIRADEEHFDRRYGLRYAEPQILVRFVDEAIQRAAGSPWSECSVPLTALAERPIGALRVVIVENKVNLLTLPQLEQTVALGGLGNSVTDLRYLCWLGQAELWYWGDIDVDGLAILSRLRGVFPHVRSFLMGEPTVQEWRSRIGSAGNGRAAPPCPTLTPAEQAALVVCAAENLRIEQERFPHAFVLDCLRGLGFELN
ncbi:MAG: hypothetical protein B7Z73_12510 [Planctomycetia bacterium 21-64-5]|nr:MAG: hypothetical protein B7Z73_12510 [Planctomycetia bacterium 21-64-5]HQU46529.1 DUF3322 domain-containing protein [Pirellulales bacterium]